MSDGFDNTQAHCEGWAIFDCDGSCNGRWQLCRLDDPAAWPDGTTQLRAPAFESDDDAWAFVGAKVRDGSAYHQGALDFLRQHNRAEYVALIAFCNLP